MLAHPLQNHHHQTFHRLQEMIALTGLIFQSLLVEVTFFLLDVLLKEIDGVPSLQLFVSSSVR
jgi:hypothetical protein